MSKLNTDLTAWPTPPILDDSNFGEKQEIIPIEQVFSLSPIQQSEFLAIYSSNLNKNTRPNKRIANYLKSKLKHFNFYSDTLTAAESLSTNHGNCLSLAILTKALADIAKVKIEFELVSTEPVYQKEGGLILASQHIRTALFDAETQESNSSKMTKTFWRNSVLIDYFPSAGTHTLRKVSKNEFYAMYYQNKAAEALISNDPNLAFWFLKYSLKLNSNDPLTINLMAVIHERIGRADAAKKLYEYGIAHFDDDFELLNNYAILLRSLGHAQEARIISKRLERFNDLNPFKWVSLGDDEYEIKNYRGAISYYKKASKLANYLHEPYFGIARAYYSLGELSYAKNAMKKAIDNSHKAESKSIYQIKYQLLTKIIEQKKQL